MNAPFIYVRSHFSQKRVWPPNCISAEPQPPHGPRKARACKERPMQFTPPLQRAGEISELRLQHSVAFFSFVLGAAGALHSVMIEAMCDNPS